MAFLSPVGMTPCPACPPASQSNLTTNRSVRIKSAAKLRYPAKTPEGYREGILMQDARK